MYKYLWHLPKTAKWFEFGDFSSREGMDSVEQWMLNVPAQDGWYVDLYMYYPHRKAIGYIFQGDILTSVEEQTRVHTPVLQCYPNPAFTQMEIRLFKDEAGVIDIVNAEGAIMQRYSVDGATTLQADVSALPTGTYFVRFGNYTNKIIIRK
jgi:hypothetical protein